MFPPISVLVACCVAITSMAESPQPSPRDPALSGGPLAVAQFRREYLDEQISERGGDPGNLPVGCQYSPEDLLLWARDHMPEVREAADEFMRRGYVAVPAADTAIVGCSYGVHASAVALAFQKPGAFIDSFHVVAPMILVTTRLHPVTGEVLTNVSGGLVIGDGETSTVFSGDSLDVFRYSDPSFDVRASRGGGGPRRDVIGTEGWFDVIRDPKSKFNQYVRCTGWNTLGCVVTHYVFGGPAKLAALLAQPEIGLGVLGGCFLASAIGCIGSL